MTDLKDLRKKITSSGAVEESEINLLRDALLNDGEGMTIEKGNLLFDLKEFSSNGKLPAGFKDLFVQAITALLLEDEESPGEISESEAKWLRAKIQYNGRIDHYDRALLNNLKKRSINFPKVLQYKSWHARMFENLLYCSRYLSVLAVIGAVLSSVVLFIQGAYIVYESLGSFVSQGPSLHYEEMFEHLVSSVDIFLFALVLVIFGVGVYELFVNKIDPVERQNAARPSWLQISSVDDLKSSLGKVILMVLIVSFFKHTLEITTDKWDPVALLYLSIGILLISAALYLTHKSHSSHDSKK